MKVSKIKVSNYRLLKSLELDMEDDLSLIIGKNNCGKTSLLSILDKFIGKKAATPSFAYDDFNIEFQKKLEEIYTTDKYQEIIAEFESIEGNKWKNIGLSLKLFIEYTENDSLANISKLMMDLDPDNRTVVLLFEYVLDEDNFKKIKVDFLEYKSKKEKEREEDEGSNTPDVEIKKRGSLFCQFMKRNSKNYFKTFKKSIAFDTTSKQENEAEFIDIINEKIPLSPVINFNIIPANREISNKDSDRTLSILASEYYKRRV